MSPSKPAGGSDPYAAQFWDDLAEIIQRGKVSRRPDYKGVMGRDMRIMAANVAAGKVANDYMGYRLGVFPTSAPLVKSLVYLAVSAFIAMSDHVPDVRDAFEIGLKEILVLVENEDFHL